MIDIKINSRKIRISLITILILIIVVGLVKCTVCVFTDFGYDTRADKEFISPNGQQTVLLRYDFVSRPFVFYEKNQVFAYPNSGFMENVKFEIEWVAENEICLYNIRFDEEYFITLE